MSFWWLQPGWTETACAKCGAKIWPEGDPDWGLCWACKQQQVAEEQGYTEACEAEEAQPWREENPNG